MRKLKKIEVLRELLNENISILRCPVCKKSIKSIKKVVYYVKITIALIYLKKDMLI